MSLLRTDHVHVSVGGHRLISDLGWQVSRGEFWCVLGQNGVGKTSLLYTLAGLLKPESGRISIDGVGIDALYSYDLARKRGLMPQQHIDAFSHTVLDTVLIGRTPYRVGRSWDTDEDKASAIGALELVGLSDKAKLDVLHLSGGERQRVGLATLLTQAPDLLLLDEPTSHQDVAHQLAMMRLIRDLSQSHAVVASCHDINLAARFATHVLVLARDRYWIGSASEVLTTDVLQQAFGCRFDLIQSGDTRSFVAN